MSDYIPGALGVFLDGKKDDKPKKKKKLITKKTAELNELSEEEENVENNNSADETLLLDPSTSEPKAKKSKKVTKIQNDAVDDGIVKKPKIKESAESKARTIYVGNLPLSTTQQQLKSLFRECGAIESARLRCAIAADPKLPKKAVVIKKAYHKEANSIGGYVRFKEVHSVAEAIKLNGTVYEGHHLRVDRAAQSRKYNPKRSVFLGNLVFNINEEDLHSHFADCGAIEAVRIVRDRHSGMGKGFGYVLFKDEGASSLALKLNGSQINGRAVRVSAVVDKKQKKKLQKSPGDPKKVKKSVEKSKIVEDIDKKSKKRKHPRVKDKKSLEELLSDKPTLHNILRKKMKKRRHVMKKR